MFLSALIVTAEATAQFPLTLAPLTMLEESVTRKQFAPFAAALSSLIDRPVTLACQKDYQTLLDQLLNDQVDLAYLGPLPYVLLTQRDPTFVPLVRFYDIDGARNYTCALAAFSGDHIDLNSGTPFRLTLSQPYSTCGYLVTEYLLNQQGQTLADGTYDYVGNHSESALTSLRGISQVSGLKTTVARNYRHLGLEIIAESPPLPGFLLVANPRTVDTATIEQIRQQLLTLSTSKNTQDQQLIALWGEPIRNGMFAVQVDDYASVRRLLSTITIPKVAP